MAPEDSATTSYLTPAQPLSPPHHYEVVDGSPEQKTYLTLLPEPRDLQAEQESKRPRTGRTEVREQRRTQLRKEQTPQRSQHTRSFKRAGPRVVAAQTYQGGPAKAQHRCAQLANPKLDTN